MKSLDRTGIFRAMPVSWRIYPSDKSQAVSVSILFKILEQLDGNEWIDWRQSEEHQVIGDFYVVGRDGGINVTTVDQLAQSLGWLGDLSVVQTEEPPQLVVQVTVKEDVFEGVTRFKASWINPGDFQPGHAGTSEGDVANLTARFGSLLRAAASAAKEKQAAKLPF